MTDFWIGFAIGSWLGLGAGIAVTAWMIFQAQREPSRDNVVRFPGPIFSEQYARAIKEEQREIAS